MKLVTHQCPQCGTTIRAFPDATVCHPCPQTKLRKGEHTFTLFTIRDDTPAESNA